MSLNELMVDELRDMYHAEKQLTKAMPKLASAATNPQLRQLLETHLRETENQITRLEQVFGLLGESATTKTCAGMSGIIDEGNDLLGEDYEGPVMDAGIIAAAQRAEHYEIGVYGTLITWAEQLGRSEVASVLRQTLSEEKSADEKLSALAESEINPAAVRASALRT